MAIPDPIHIFSTRKMEPLLRDRFQKEGFAYEEREFIRVTQIFDPQTFREEINAPDTQARIFTSKNTVYSLEKLLRSEPLNLIQKKNFCVGLKTSELLEGIGVYVHARAGNAISLAQIIARNKEINAVSYFCGDKALDDLPEYLGNKGVRVKKEIVYQTELLEHRLLNFHPDGILFLSPSAVFSFFKFNRLKPDTPCFCIGSTTSEAVHFKCNNKRIIADEPSAESLTDKVIQYFKKHKH